MVRIYDEVGRLFARRDHYIRGVLSAEDDLIVEAQQRTIRLMALASWLKAEGAGFDHVRAAAEAADKASQALPCPSRSLLPSSGSRGRREKRIGPPIGSCSDAGLGIKWSWLSLCMERSTFGEILRGRCRRGTWSLCGRATTLSTLSCEAN